MPQADATDRLPSKIDVRQMSLFGGGWTLGSLKYLAEAGADSVTFYEVAGWAGLMERPGGSPRRGEFRSISDGVFPLYHVFADAAEFSGGDVTPVRSSEPLKVEAMLLRQGDRGRLMVANMTGSPQTFALPTWLKSPARLRSLTADSYMDAATRPGVWRKTSSKSSKGGELALPPYAVFTLDGIA